MNPTVFSDHTAISRAGNLRLLLISLFVLHVDSIIGHVFFSMAFGFWEVNFVFPSLICANVLGVRFHVCFVGLMCRLS